MQQKCVKDMYAIAASQMGCSDLQASCLCKVPDFKYGVRDCSSQACIGQNGGQVAKDVMTWYWGQLCCMYFQLSYSGSIVERLSPF
jgi:hypothetical protein